MRTMEQHHTSQSPVTGDNWAERLAQSRLPAPPTHETTAAKPLLDAIAAMWDLFDQTLRQANEAMGQAGVPERITVCRTGNEGRYDLVTTDGGSRTISVFVNAPVVHEHIFGGVEISNSQTRQPISLVPVLEADLVRWQVAPLGSWFDEELVHNLFLSVFGDDPVATARLSPLSSIDAFGTPWR